MSRVYYELMDTQKKYHTKNINLGKDICEYLDDLAKREDRSVSSVVRLILLEVMAADPAYTLPADKETEGTP